MATVSCGERAAREGGALVVDGGLAAKMSSNNANRGASGHTDDIASRSAVSPQQIKPGSASPSIGAGSPAAWRAYIGTAMSPSAIIARSRAAHRILFGATNAQRSP